MKSLYHNLMLIHGLAVLILLALLITGISVFFDFMDSRHFYQFHGALFALLMVLVAVNVVSMLIGKLKNRLLIFL